MRFGRRPRSEITDDSAALYREQVNRILVVELIDLAPIRTPEGLPAQFLDEDRVPQSKSLFEQFVVSGPNIRITSITFRSIRKGQDGRKGRRETPMPVSRFSGRISDRVAQLPAVRTTGRPAGKVVTGSTCIASGRPTAVNYVTGGSGD